MQVTIYEDIMLFTAPSLLLSVYTGSEVHSVSAGFSLPWINPSSVQTWPLILLPSTAKVKTSGAATPFIHMFSEQLYTYFTKKDKYVWYFKVRISSLSPKAGYSDWEHPYFFRISPYPRQMLWKLILGHDDFFQFSST